MSVSTVPHRPAYCHSALVRRLVGSRLHPVQCICLQICYVSEQTVVTFVFTVISEKDGCR